MSAYRFGMKRLDEKAAIDMKLKSRFGLTPKVAPPSALAEEEATVSQLIIDGPVLNYAESGWDVFGLVLRAERNVTLVSARFPNRGLATTVELRRYSDSSVLASFPVPAGNTNFTVDINYPLTSGEVYSLVSTTRNNNYFANAGGAYAIPLTNADLTVLHSLFNTIVLDMYWCSFNDITTAYSN